MKKRERRDALGCIPAIEDPNYFEDLAPEEIYDSFFTIKRMGFLANRIIRKLSETKYIITNVKILEKRKKFKQIQRKQFEQLSPAGVEYLKVLMKAEIASLQNNPQVVESSLSPYPNVKARLGHLAADPHSAEILRKIYVTDSSVRTLELWKHLADDFVNNPHWVPRRVVDDRLYDVDPGYAPEEKITAENLRAVYSRLRIEYTRAMLKFTSTPRASFPAPQPLNFPTPMNLLGAQHEDDNDFWERFAKHDKGLFYIYLLFKGTEGAQWQQSLMVDMDMARSDVDIVMDRGSAPPQTPNFAGLKRDHSSALLGAQGGDDLYVMDEGVPHIPQDDEALLALVRKNRAIAMYYRRKALNTDIKFYFDVLHQETTSEVARKNAKNKIYSLLIKKVEDRYDDLNFNFTA